MRLPFVLLSTLSFGCVIGGWKPGDADGDGYTFDQGDCWDSPVSPDGSDIDGSQIHPGAAELCNGIDDDCDGFLDEDDASDAPTWYTDTDDDGYGDPAYTRHACEAPASHVADNTDCDDTRAEVHPGAIEVCAGGDEDCDGLVDAADPDLEGAPTWYADTDGDGYGDATAALCACDAPKGYGPDGSDCDDTRAEVHPGATEVCGGGDDDCDELIDDFDPDLEGDPTWYADADADGYGDPTCLWSACEAPKGYGPDNTDCDDTRPLVNPAAAEICDGEGTDEDCDGLSDDQDPSVSDPSRWFADLDQDGYGDPGDELSFCVAPPGHASDDTDCDDLNAGIHPGAVEVCDSLDDDCDGLVDDSDPDLVGTFTWYGDDDGDGFGDPASSVTACQAPKGHVLDDTDCADGNSDVHPGAPELCVPQAVDNDCDGIPDDQDPDLVGAPTWFRVLDRDGYGDPSDAQVACVQPALYVADGSDCRDGSAQVNPGAAETCNGVDDDCDSSIDEGVTSNYYGDADADGYGTSAVTIQACAQPAHYAPVAGDCNESVAAINPGVPELCNNVDDDCDNQVDEGVIVTWYGDGDGDGFGHDLLAIQACVQPTSFVPFGGDCDDGETTVHPGATESCNMVDDDCDSLVDEGLFGVWYADLDLDGNGNSAAVSSACAAPTGYVALADDCDDNDPDIHPGAAEDCNGVDDDCDGWADLGAGCPCGIQFYIGRTDHPYMFCHDTVAWATALTNCNDYGYDLVTIEDQLENDFVQDQADIYNNGADSKWWIGLNDLISEGVFVWEDGSGSTWRVWSTAPVDANKNCVAIKSNDGHWDDEGCGGIKYYVCEAD